ncbi:hypothetical protein EVAR_53851_1 [Eumeta japonica]|uniref:Uncharacterized protein n=1 Tax=Eumeta variegata TaxID=151549 RepID=A0A4C1XFW1_EUMVA|nr:hypothetical protein EVAR_53851_1 [Eumeta japonica]
MQKLAGGGLYRSFESAFRWPPPVGVSCPFVNLRGRYNRRLAIKRITLIARLHPIGDGVMKRAGTFLITLPLYKVRVVNAVSKTSAHTQPAVLHYFSRCLVGLSAYLIKHSVVFVGGGKCAQTVQSNSLTVPSLVIAPRKSSRGTSRSLVISLAPTRALPTCEMKETPISQKRGCGAEAPGRAAAAVNKSASVT